MTQEDEPPLVKRPEITPGPLIVGALESVSGSLINMTSFALERITRERTEIPPQFKLPERPVYFLDPNSKRMVMISNREALPGRPVWQTGLFAEIVELDDEGKPRFQLSTEQVLLSGDNFTPVAVGPNEFNLPPSFIEMKEVEESGKEKFVPWNFYLGSLQAWMNEVKIEEGDTFESFMNRFYEFRKQSEQEASGKIRRSFPGGTQGFDDMVAPYNFIITDELHRKIYEDASRAVGLFPVTIGPREFVEMDLHANENFAPQRWGYERRYWLANYLPASWNSEAKNYLPAVITNDWTAAWRLEEIKTEFSKRVIPPISRIHDALRNIALHHPIFSQVFLTASTGELIGVQVVKEENGYYYCPNNEEDYREFLYKIKADLLLTMFVRGGAPLVR